jgi:hypothetical protein
VGKAKEGIEDGRHLPLGIEGVVIGILVTGGGKE